jgi:serine/threonine-protein kinase RsbW
MRHGSSSQRSGEGWTVRRRGPEIGATARWAGASDASPQTADVRLTLPARPENVALVRRVLAALAEALGLPPEARDDLRLAVTEACTNVVRHAYGGRAGRIEVLARPEGDALQVIVSDTGVGIAGGSDTGGPGFGLGLMEALTERLEVAEPPGGGSRLEMWFTRHHQIPEPA